MIFRLHREFVRIQGVEASICESARWRAAIFRVAIRAACLAHDQTEQREDSRHERSLERSTHFPFSHRNAALAHAPRRRPALRLEERALIRKPF